MWDTATNQQRDRAGPDISWQHSRPGYHKPVEPRVRISWIIISPLYPHYVFIYIYIYLWIPFSYEFFSHSSNNLLTFLSLDSCAGSSTSLFLHYIPIISPSLFYIYIYPVLILILRTFLQQLFIVNIPIIHIYIYIYIHIYIYCIPILTFLSQVHLSFPWFLRATCTGCTVARYSEVDRCSACSRRWTSMSVSTDENGTQGLKKWGTQHGNTLYMVYVYIYILLLIIYTYVHIYIYKNTVYSIYVLYGSGWQWNIPRVFCFWYQSFLPFSKEMQGCTSKQGQVGLARQQEVLVTKVFCKCQGPQPPELWCGIFWTKTWFSYFFALFFMLCIYIYIYVCVCVCVCVFW